MLRSPSGRSNSGLIVLSQKSGVGSQCPIDGLTIEETVEFEAIDALPPLDDNGNIAWTFGGEPITDREKRWLELYNKHVRARRVGK
jgi:hypothetical protein